MKDRSTQTANMSTERTKPIAASDERPISEPAKPVEEGVAVFRGLIMTALLYALIGAVAWFAWFAWKHWLVHR
jgi:hypothetical protein